MKRTRGSHSLPEDTRKRSISGSPENKEQNVFNIAIVYFC